MKDDAFSPEREFAGRLDAADSLSRFRSRFVIADPGTIYLDGNSLGRLPFATVERLQHVLQAEWGGDLVSSWNKGWYEAPRRIGDRISRLVGAEPGQVVVSDSTSTNIYKLSVSALALQPNRKKIVSDELNFPTDLYILQGVVQLMDNRHTLCLIPSADGISTETAAIVDAIDEDTALVALSHPTFKSGSLYDIEAIMQRAHKVGALVLWDMCHGVGVLPLELDRWAVDFAVGCTYKYLNGGPGSPAFIYVRSSLQERIAPPISGWWGHQTPFAFDLEFRPAEGIERFLVGTPPMLSLLALEPALDIVLEAGIQAVRQKSMQMTSYLVYLFDTFLLPLGFTLGSPREAERRGSHVSLGHPQGYQIARALIEEMGVIPDFREPDLIRLGMAPLYTTYTEVWDAVERIRRATEEKRYLKYPPDRSKVT